MKNFKNYTPEKYTGSGFLEIEEGIYQTKSPYGDKDIFVTSLSFEMEQECFGEEDASPRNLTQISKGQILRYLHDPDELVIIADSYKSKSLP